MRSQAGRVGHELRNDENASHRLIRVIGVGFGGNFLVGGPSNAYALQPLSVQGQTGLNVAAGIAGVELQPVRFGRGGRIHHYRRHRG